MPWRIRRSGNKWQVVNQDTGRVMGEHDTKAKAMAQLRALYANYEGKGKGGKS